MISGKYAGTSSDELKARILATKAVGTLGSAIAKCNYTITELTKLLIELPDKKIRRWNRNRKQRQRSAKDERQPDLL